MTSTTTTLQVTPLAAPLGASVTGLDPARASAADVYALLEAFRTHHVLVLPAQPLTDDHILTIGSWLGPQYQAPEGIPVFGTDAQGTVSVLSNQDDKGIGSRIPLPFHTDFQYMPVPLLGAVLHAVEVPPSGGDTLWSNLHTAYEELEPAVSARIEGLRGVGINPFAGQGLGRAFTGDGQHFVADEVPDFPHPLVRTHPDTGRRSLYFSSFIVKLLEADGSRLDPAEEHELIDLLAAHVEQDHLYYRHQWTRGDTVIWDNRCTNHKRDDFDQSYAREMHRIQIAGTTPF
jgi:taurine dioxygenase